MEKFLAALQEQLEYMVDAEENNVDSFRPMLSSPGFVVTTEDDETFYLEVSAQ